MAGAGYHMMLGSGNRDFTARLGELKMPVLIINGEFDNSLNRRRAQARVHFRVHAGKIPAALALREVFADQAGEMLDVKPRVTLEPVTGRAGFATRRRSCPYFICPTSSSA